VRICIVKELLGHNADVCVQDKSGDTCLHWLARKHDRIMSMVLFDLCQETLLAADILNNRGRRPIDVAQKFPKSSRATHTSFLEDRMAKSAFERKAMATAQAREEQETAAVVLKNDLLARSLEDAYEETERIRKYCKDTHLQAEMARRAAEKEVVDLAMQNALEQARLWLKGPYGSNELKMLAKTVRKDIKEKEKRRGKSSSNSGGTLEQQAKKKAAELLLKRKQNEAKSKAIEEFRTRNPPL